MAKTPKRLYGPAQLSTPVVTRYTAPASTKTIIRHIHVFNPAGSAVPFTLSIGADAAGTRIYDAFSIAAGQELDRWCYYVVDAAEIVQAFAGTVNNIVLTLDGDENTP